MCSYCLGSTASLSGLQFWTALVSVVAFPVVTVITTTSSATAWTLELSTDIRKVFTVHGDTEEAPPRAFQHSK